MTKVEILISAMHQKDMALADLTHADTDVLIINQCDTNSILEEIRDYGKVRMISTKERGLSRSRNMAIKNATGKYCLLCDDDEFLYKGYEKSIEEAYEKYPDADIICFHIKRKGKNFPQKVKQINYITSLKIASWQITFKPEKIHKADIEFDINFGSGTPVGSGEENIFLFDCLKAGLKVIYVPVCIGEVAQTESQWFKGFTQSYFENRGIIIRRMMGYGFGFIYCLYFVVTKYSKYKNDISFVEAFKHIIKGMNMKTN